MNRGLWGLVRHEARLLSREGSLWIALAVLVLSVGYASSTGRSLRAERGGEVASEIATAAEHLAEEKAAVAAGEPGGFSGRAGAVRTVAMAPPGRLADFAIGQSELLPYRGDISPFRRLDNIFHNYQLQSPLTLLSGRFDLGFVVIYLLPLLLMAVSYDLLSAEKERGTLALAASQPVPISRFLYAKLIARVVLIIGSFAGLATVAFLVSPEPTSERALLFVLWLSLAIAYGVFWVAAAAFVNASGRSSETNAVILACTWLLLVVVVPALLNVLVSAVAPTPSRLTYVTEMRAATVEASKRSADLLATYYEDHPELAAEEMQSGFLPAYFSQQREIERRVQPILESFESRLAGQQRVVGATSFLSPAVLVQETFNDIAGTGTSRQRSFVIQSRTFLNRWLELLSPKIFTKEEMEPADYDRLPTFAFIEPTLRDTVGRAAASFGVLLLASLGLLFAARRRLRTFPIAS